MFIGDFGKVLYIVIDENLGKNILEDAQSAIDKRLDIKWGHVFFTYALFHSVPSDTFSLFDIVKNKFVGIDEQISLSQKK